MDLQHQVLLASAHLWVSPQFSPDSPVEICFDWDRRSVSFQCQPAPITQRVRWTPMCRIQTKLKVILALSSLHLLKLWEDWQPADCAPVLFLNAESKHKRQPWTLPLLQNRYFSCVFASEEPPELLSSSASQINQQRNTTAALKGVISKGWSWWKPCCSPSLIRSLMCFAL